MNRNQKKGIALQIDDTIDTMTLRLQLNQQAIKTQLNRSTYVDDGLDFIHAITDKKHEAHLVIEECKLTIEKLLFCLLYTSPSPRDATLSRMPSAA